MTRVVCAVTPKYVVQAADRRVILTADGWPEYDALANKIIVYGATDGLITIGFSGNAYINGVPTDEWLASFLWDGQPVPRGHDGIRPVLLTGGRTNFWDIADTALKLKNELDAKLSKAEALYLSIAGWQLDENRELRPVLIELEKSAGGDRVEHGDAVGYRDLHKYFEGFSIIGDGADTADVESDWRPFYQRGRPPTLEEAEATVVDIVRNASTRIASVGPHVTTVAIPRLDLGAPYCRFHPAKPHTLSISGAAVTKKLEVGFAPWLLGNGRMAQSIQVSDLEMSFGDILFTVYTPGGQRGLLLSSTTPRMPAR